MSDLAAGLGGRIGRGAQREHRIRGCDFLRRCTERRRISPAEGLANPTALLMSSILMLNHLGEPSASGAD